MINVFKQGGDWKARSGESYTVKAISNDKLSAYLSDGWSSCLEDAFAIEAEYKPVETADYESELRERIKALGGKPSGRAKISTLEKQLIELENDNED